MEVNDLNILRKYPLHEDYTLAWWDYGYPIWYYSILTLIDGGKHQNDNFIISKILQTSSSDFAVNLSRLAVETYVDSNYKVVADTMFKNKQKDQLIQILFLSELEDYNISFLTKHEIFIYIYRIVC